MRMRTWVGPGSGVGISRTSHGAPAAGTMAAFMAYSFSRMRRAPLLAPDAPDEESRGMRRAVPHASVHPSLTLPIARFEVGFTNPANAAAGHALPPGTERPARAVAAPPALTTEAPEPPPARAAARD